MPIRLLHIDAFTDRPLTGNPAAVCFLDQEADTNWMQALGNEMNLPETAFVRPIEGPPGSYELRWFTPAIEVDLCGHATIASAHAMWQEQIVSGGQPIYFHTRSGILIATRSGDLIELDFPALQVSVCEPPTGLVDALGIPAAAAGQATPVFTGRTQFDAFLEVESAEQLRQAKPNFYQLARVPTRGIIVTSRSDDARYEYLARFFAPAAGIPEDHATGSAHCALAPYWQPKLGKNKFTAYQASPRGGVIHTELKNDRVLLGGQAVTIFRGHLEA
jgi:PhzF family phenazine biosynthesis protein